MSPITAVLVLLGAACSSAFLTGVVRRYALNQGLLDEPNARSSHTAATPRGGGLAVVLSFLMGLIIWVTIDRSTLPDAIVIGGAALVVAAIGFWDDHGHVRPSIRLMFQAGAGLWVIYWLEGLPHVPVPYFASEPLWLELIVFMACWIGFVWIVNLFNFMDGIDGIATVEAATVAVGGAAVGIVMGYEVEATAVLLAAAVLGFLPWNWPPARIFMGDIGSGFIGAVLAATALQAGADDPTLLAVWLILLGVFISDATVTLLRRAVRGEKVYEAHRTHAYQHAARSLQSHQKVTFVIFLINCFWLFPIAIICALGRLDAITGLLIAYFPLLLLCWKWRSGGPEKTGAMNPLGRQDRTGWRR